MALSRTLATCLFVFGLVAVFAQDEREMPIPRKLETQDSRKSSFAPKGSDPWSMPPPSHGRHTMRSIPSGSPKNSIPSDSKGKPMDTRRNQPRRKPQGIPKEIKAQMELERHNQELQNLQAQLAAAQEQLQGLRRREEAARQRGGQDGAGPSGAGGSGAGGSGAGGSGSPRRRH